MAKALSVWPEWAWAIVNLDKRIENRTYQLPSTAFGKRIAIHASKSIGGGLGGKKGYITAILRMVTAARTAGWFVTTSPFDFNGKIMFAPFGFNDRIRFEKNGVVRFFEQDKIPKGCIVATARIGQRNRDDQSFVKEWGEPTGHHWALFDLNILSEPVPCKGSQSFWSIPIHIIDLSNRQLADQTTHI